MIHSLDQLPQFKMVNFGIDSLGRTVHLGPGVFRLVYEHPLYVFDDGSFLKSINEILHRYVGCMVDPHTIESMTCQVDDLHRRTLYSRAPMTSDNDEAARCSSVMSQQGIKPYWVRGNPEYFKGVYQGLSIIKDNDVYSDQAAKSA